ncbi:MAG: hypothetical protein ABEK50_00275, partial [bacterium]
LFNNHNREATALGSFTLGCVQCHRYPHDVGSVFDGPSVTVLTVPTDSRSAQYTFPVDLFAVEVCNS